MIPTLIGFTFAAVVVCVVVILSNESSESVSSPNVQQRLTGKNPSEKALASDSQQVVINGPFPDTYDRSELCQQHIIGRHHLL